MENYDCNQSAERVLMDASRKKNQNRNRLLFIVITITVGVIFSVFSLIYGKMEIDIQKNMKADGMAVSTYIENGTADMTQQLTQLPCIESIGKEKFAGKLLDDSIKYCDCVITDVTGFEKMIRPAFTNVVGTYPEKENEIMLLRKLCNILESRIPKWAWKLNWIFIGMTFSIPVEPVCRTFYFLGILQSIKIKPPVLLWLYIREINGEERASMGAM